MNNPYYALKPYEMQEIKYDKFCKILGIEKKTGKAKILQLNQIKQYVALHQQNRKIFIEKVYEDDLELQIIEKHGKFTTYIENFLMENLHSLKGQNNDCVVFTNRNILEMAYMVNKNYFVGKRCPYLFIDQLNVKMNKGDMPDETFLFNQVLQSSDIFFSASYRLLKRVIYDCLMSMEKRSLIHVTKIFRLYRNYKDANGKFKTEEHDCLTDNEINRILTVQYQSVREFNEMAEEYEDGRKKYFLKNIFQLYKLYPKQKKEFFDILNTNLVEEFKDDGGWNAYSTAWKINMASQESFDYEIRKLNYKKLNDNVADKLLTASDLTIIENTLREQLVNTFIRIGQK